MTTGLSRRHGTKLPRAWEACLAIALLSMAPASGKQVASPLPAAAGEKRSSVRLAKAPAAEPAKKADGDSKTTEKEGGERAGVAAGKKKAESPDGASQPRAKKGLFGIGKGKAVEPERGAAKPEAEAGKPAPAQEPVASGSREPVAAEKKVEPAKAKSETAQAEPEPVLVPDAALISVLKDIARGLAESEEAAKIEDPCQKAALAVAESALKKAVSNPDLAADRILSPKEKARLEKSMQTEAWASGSIAVSDACHASLSAVWAKKVDGLINLAIAGNCSCNPSAGGQRVGEFVFVANGKSSVDSGFDIQSQSEVNYWLGKLTGISVDTSCCSESQTPEAGVSEKKQGAVMTLSAVLTERSRSHMAAMAKHRQHLLALKAEEEARLEADRKAKEEAEAKTRAEEEAKARAEKEAKARAEEEGKAGEKRAASPGDSPAGDRPSAPEKQAEAEKQPGSDSAAKAGGPAAISDPRAAALAEADFRQHPVPAPVAVAAVAPAAVRSSGPPPEGWDSPPAPPPAKLPSPGAQVVLPDKAIAGQFLTAAVLNQKHAPETEVELSFNGAAIATGVDGRALYLVPEDALPGPTLNVALTGRPEKSAVVYVQQPIGSPEGPQLPRIDGLSPIALAGGTITIEGHSFDGVANRNSVVIDGMYDARVLVSSPVQIKADLPRNLIAGQHSVSVSTGGLRSNPGQLELVVIELEPLPRETQKDVLKKLVVRATGTKSPVRLRVKNLTPDIIRLNKGNELRVVTAGGANNSVVIDAQRLRPGAYNVEAYLE